MNNFFQFDSPQRQSTFGWVVMFGDTMQQLIRGLWLPIFFFLYKGSTKQLLFFVVLSLVVLVVVGVFSYLNFRNFTFYLDKAKGCFVVKKGIFSKKVTSVNLDRIQQVNINQNFIQRLIGVYQLEIDTAGGKNKEISIKAIKYKLAEALKAELLSARTLESASQAASTVIEVQPESLVKISFSTLIKVGLTSNYLRSLGLIVAFVITVFDHLKSFIEQEVISDMQLQKWSSSSFWYNFYLYVFLFLVLILFNVGRTLVPYFGYTITQLHSTLKFNFGLLTKKNILLPQGKVQMVIISQNLFQKKLNISSLNVFQATTGEVQQEGKANESRVIVPGVNSGELTLIQSIILPGFILPKLVLRPNYRWMFKRFLWQVVIPVVAFLVFCWKVNWELQSNIIIAIAYTLLMSVFIVLGYRKVNYRISDHYLVEVSGVWDTDKKIIAVEKLQNVIIKQYPWHVSKNLVHLTLQTAGGTLHFDYVDYSQIKPYVNYWLYKIETSGKASM